MFDPNTEIHVSRTESEIAVRSPYSPEMPSAAKKLGGRWSATEKTWRFDLRDEERVADLVRSLYGIWPEDGSVDLVTARVTVMGGMGGSIFADQGAVFFGGREGARARGRDSGARLGSGIVVLEGEFTSGGSAKNWDTRAKAGTVFEVRDIPRVMAKKEQNHPTHKWTVEIVSQPTIDRAKLLAERDKLIARLAEIEKCLAEQPDKEI